MSEYVSRVTFALDGKEYDDIKNFKEMEIDVHEMVALMNKTGYVRKTPHYQFSVDYVVPAANRADFSGIRNVSAVVGLDGGGVINYTGVFIMKMGEVAFDGEKEAVQTLTFGAQGRQVG